MKLPKRFKTLWLPLFIFAAVIVVFYKTIDRFPDVLAAVFQFLGLFSPIIIAAVIAFILYIPQNKIEKLFQKLKEDNYFRKHSRGISVLITYLLLIIAFKKIAASIFKNFGFYNKNPINVSFNKVHDIPHILSANKFYKFHFSVD